MSTINFNQFLLGNSQKNVPSAITSGSTNTVEVFKSGIGRILAYILAIIIIILVILLFINCKYGWYRKIKNKIILKFIQKSKKNCVGIMIALNEFLLLKRVELIYFRFICSFRSWIDNFGRAREAIPVLPRRDLFRLPLLLE